MLKKVLVAYLVIMLLLFIACDVALAFLDIEYAVISTSYTEDDIEYNLPIFSRTAVVKYYTGTGDSVVIPETVKGRKVTGISGQAFEGSTIKSIEIPDSVKRIGLDAFDGCTSLYSVYFTGTEEEWDNVEMGKSSLPSYATVYYNYSAE